MHIYFLFFYIIAVFAEIGILTVIEREIAKKIQNFNFINLIFNSFRLINVANDNNHKWGFKNLITLKPNFLCSLAPS